MPWKKYEFKGQTVYVRVLATGKPIVHRGRVELRYKLGARKSYKAAPDNLVELPDETEIITDAEMSGSGAGDTTQAAMAALREEPSTPADDETIILYTDGACSGNPGPAGIGVLMQRPDQTIEISEFLGSATNNIAELSAILKGLRMLRDEDAQRSIHLYTDSGWSLGVLVGGWKAKANLELIEEIRVEMAKYPRLELLKIRGHSGQEGNEEADRLATQATRREASSEPRVRPRRR
ncbi:ribonuclease HI [Paraliomyxa miuraensis]|uniref:ribonuclease HI n=1 Tax=Paraliomyxa miuraensis TaxID=376150 RepID=UPI002257E39A|nr:ribonuclease H [Paraliomyxa miuraensis]MCX4244808.1 reverse transcriptase-like protein [Paraliomyxa miuraensis]